MEDVFNERRHVRRRGNVTYVRGYIRFQGQSCSHSPASVTRLTSDTAGGYSLRLFGVCFEITLAVATRPALRWEKRDLLEESRPMLTALKRMLPWHVKQRVGGWMALLRSQREHVRLAAHRRELDQRHLDGCLLINNRTNLLARLPKEGVVAEVGVAQGNFSRQILEVARPRTLHLIDTWSASRPGYDVDEYERIRTTFGTGEYANKVVLHRKMSWEGIAELGSGSIDWIYIDADHSYDAVKKDLAAAIRAIKPDGLIAGHDYICWSSPNGRYGVIEAVNELCHEHDFVFRFLSLEPDMHLSYAIQRAS